MGGGPVAPARPLFFCQGSIGRTACLATPAIDNGSLNFFGKEKNFLTRDLLSDAEAEVKSWAEFILEREGGKIGKHVGLGGIFTEL